MTDAELEELERLIQRLAITPTNMPLSDWCQLSDGVLSLLSTIRTLKAEVEGTKAGYDVEIQALCEALWKREPGCEFVRLNYPQIAAALSALDQEDTP